MQAVKAGQAHVHKKSADDIMRMFDRPAAGGPGGFIPAFSMAPHPSGFGGVPNGTGTQVWHCCRARHWRLLHTWLTSTQHLHVLFHPGWMLWSSLLPGLVASGHQGGVRYRWLHLPDSRLLAVWLPRLRLCFSSSCEAC